MQSRAADIRKNIPETRVAYTENILSRWLSISRLIILLLLSQYAEIQNPWHACSGLSEP